MTTAPPARNGNSYHNGRKPENGHAAYADLDAGLDAGLAAGWMRPVHPEAVAPAPASTQPGQPSYADLLAQVVELQRTRDELEQKRYVDSSQTRFAERMRWQPGQSLEEWADQLLMDLVPYVEGLQAALYVAEEVGGTPRLRLIGGYACPTTVPQAIQFGEGITGEVARSRKPVFLTDSSSFTTHVSSGLSKVEAQALLVEPLVHAEQVEGVLEVSALQAFSEGQRLLLRQLSETLAANLSSVKQQVRIQNLYREAQEQREMLLAQEEEMRQNVEELEATQEEMKRVQRAMAESEARLHSVIHSSRDLIFVLDGQYRLLFANHAFREMYAAAGVTLQEGETLLDYVPETERPEWRMRWDRALAGETFTVEDVSQSFGETQYFEVSYYPLLGEGGKQVGISIFSRNITLRKQAEIDLQQANEELETQQEELRQNMEELQATQDEMARSRGALEAANERFRRMSNNLDGMIYQYRLDTATGRHGFAYVSDRCVELFGKRPEEVVDAMDKENVLEVHADDLAHFTAVFTESATKLQPFRWTGRLSDGHGGYRYIEAISTPELLPDGCILWDGYMHDVSVRIEAEHRAAEQNLIAQELFLRSPDGIGIMVDGKFVDCNPALVQMYGFSDKESVLGKSPLDVSPERQYDGTPTEEAVMKPITECLANGSVTFEWLHQRPDGSTWDAEVHLSVVDLPGRVGTMFFRLKDITAQKRGKPVATTPARAVRQRTKA